MNQLQKARITADELEAIVGDVRARFTYDDEIPSEEDIAATVLLDTADQARERVNLSSHKFMGYLRPHIRMATDGGMVFTWAPRGACEYCGRPRKQT
ncbi:MAG: hypothetical protein ACR2RF_32265 [Geminicoccaceae bacterium]